VPPSVARKIGKNHIVRSLKTRDVKVARERRWPALAEIRAFIAAQDGGEWLGNWLPPKFDPLNLALEHRNGGPLQARSLMIRAIQGHTVIERRLRW